MSTTIPTAGTRIHWQGDHSNGPRTGTVSVVAEGYMLVQWDGQTTTKPVPIGVMASPRWSVVPS